MSTTSMRYRDRVLKLRIFVMFLCASTFTWGLQAKLSLYEAATPSHPLLIAKLLQDWQITKKSDGSLPQDCSHLTGPSDFYAAVARKPQFATGLSILVRPSSVSAQSCDAYALYVKPPPANA